MIVESEAEARSQVRMRYGISGSASSLLASPELRGSHGDRPANQAEHITPANPDFGAKCITEMPCEGVEERLLCKIEMLRPHSVAGIAHPECSEFGEYFPGDCAAQRAPPPTRIVSPVIHADASDARKTATAAISPGSPNRPSGVTEI